jgi:HAD superfamily hydrolase (TIGR01484 family)
LSAAKVTKGLTTNIPVIVYNGVSIINAHTKEKYVSLSLNKDESKEIKKLLVQLNIYPLVYAYIDGEEKVSWIRGMENEGISNYIGKRKGDPRLRPVDTVDELYQGEIFYFTCIGGKDRLAPIHDTLKDNPSYTITFQQELYREGEYWFEIMPIKATKGNAVNTLKGILKCGRIVSFGDSLNDIPMFQISDESYAVENAAEELKKIATGIIPSNDDDGVAKWLEENVI